MVVERPSVSAGFLTAYPEYLGSFRNVLNVLISRSSPYAPEEIELGREDNYRTIPFDPHLREELARMWESHPSDTPGWILKRNNPVQCTTLVTKGPGLFEFVNVSIERHYLEEPQKLAEFLELLKEFYSILHPAYGDVLVQEMVRSYDHALGKLKIGTDLDRALPDVYWANFLGPEYVNMFGADRVRSAPCYSVQSLSDGGALLLLSRSPLNYFNNLEEFEKTRENLKAYLGIEAFDTGDLSFRGKIPRFRYVEERRRYLAVSRPKRPVNSPDMLAQLTREECEQWFRDNNSFSSEFVREMEPRGVKLDFSEQSLKELDAYVHRVNESKITFSVEFLKKLAAYVSQVIIRNTGATLSFHGSKGIPSLWLGEVQLSPLARAQKVISEGETFEHWYQFITRDLLPAVRAKRSSA